MTIRTPVFALTAAYGAAVACLLGLAAPAVQADVAATLPKPVEGDYVIPNYQFASGETLPQLRSISRPSASRAATRTAGSTMRS